MRRIWPALLVPCATVFGELTVVSVSPSQNGLNAPTGAPISITFDRAVDRATVSASSIGVFGKWSGPATGAFTFSAGDTVVTFDPDQNFSAGEMVMVALANSLRAADGTSLRDAGYCWQYWTRTRVASLDLVRTATMSTNFPSGASSRPYGGVGTDFNGDGWLDLTMVCEDTADLRVLLNTGDGLGTYGAILQPASSIGFTASPSDTADFDRDGHADICVTVPSTGNVAILLGNGDGTFQPRQDVAVGATPYGVGAIDVDGDGDLDIVNANATPGNVSVLRNDDGVFSPPTFFDAGVSAERGLAATDMDNDGILDFVVGGISSGTATVNFGNGDGTFSTSGATQAGGAVWMMVAGDIDADGDPDIAVANSTSNRASILRNNAGVLAGPVNLSTDPFTLSVDYADFDGDGDLDLITSSYSGDWRLFLNNGAGTFAFDREFDASVASSCAIPLDIDNDRDLDIALVDEEADTIQIYKNDGTGLTTDTNGDCVIDLTDLGEMLANYGCAGGVCAGDVDDDDDVDLSDLGELLSDFGAVCP